MNLTIKRLTTIVASLVMIGGMGLSVGLKPTSNYETEAATTETSRLWAKIVNKDQWDSAGASTYIHYWGGSSSTEWFGVPIKWDATNDLVYYDVPQDTTSVVFVRVSADKTSVWDQTADLVATGHFDSWYFYLTGYGGGEWKNDLSIQTTTIVSNYAATIDTSGEACSAGSAQAAVNAYNALSTFEQDQFDALLVGGGMTGLQRLNYLKTFYSIATPLNAADNLSINDNKLNVSLLIILSILTISGASLLVLKQKKA